MGQVLKVNGRVIKPDGYDPTTNTIYEFYGDYWHGNPDVFDLNQINKSNKMTFGTLYNKTMNREYFLIKTGYKVISVWEKEFDNE